MYRVKFDLACQKNANQKQYEFEKYDKFFQRTVKLKIIAELSKTDQFSILF